MNVMMIIKDCWDKINCCDCQYGGYIASDQKFSIYINNWLSVNSEIKEFFASSNDGYVGHCVVEFDGLIYCEIKVSQYSKNEKDEIIWSPELLSKYTGRSNLPGRQFVIGGSIKGFPTAVEILIEAESCNLIVLKKDEPARE